MRHEDHAMMDEVWQRGEYGGFLAAPLRGGREEHAEQLTEQSPGLPERAGTVPEDLKLRSRCAEACWDSEQNAVGPFQIVQSHVGMIGVAWSGVERLQQVCGQCLWELSNPHFNV